MFHPLAVEEDERVRLRDRACLAAAVTTGAGMGLLASAVVAGPTVLLFSVGAMAGAVVGRVLASHISTEEWDPPPNHHDYVGANSPDDDIASG